uniref:Uncharacterized protein n=1 Tax=Anguilla anguilla TaxID=7936 RepID=A0A0E9UKX9_ANGAN
MKRKTSLTKNQRLKMDREK